MDFMSDALLSGRKFRTLNLLDDFHREALAIEIDTSLPAERVVRILEQTIQWRGKPQRIRLIMVLNSSPASLASGVKNIRLTFNLFNPESHHKTHTLNALMEASGKIYLMLTCLKRSVEWMHDYNYERPHDALDGRSPVDMLAVDLWKTPEEFPTNLQRVITTTINEIF